MCDYSKCYCEIFSMDSKTPLKVHLSAYYKRSFAFHTVKERLPVILTQIVDHLVRDKENIVQEYGQKAREEIKSVVGEISKLKYELQTNKPLQPLDSPEPDAGIYNRYLAEQSQADGKSRYFTAIWLHAECYMYRRVRNLFENTKSLKKFDPFAKQKKDSFTQSLSAIVSLSEYLLPLVQNPNGVDVKAELLRLLKLNLWGNRCDLSISAGTDNSQTTNPLTLIDKYECCILSDHSEKIWTALNESTESGIIDFINDNAGYEMFTDFCLADFLITHKLAEKICFNIKAIPWFISDTTPNDLQWIIQSLVDNENEILRTIGTRWNNYLNDSVWTYKTDDFWTLPFDFTYMKSQSPSLYERLSESKMLIFKGDLNYRKLFGEINWEASTPVAEALQGFQPTKLCVLRTIKADIVCGLRKGLAERLDAKDPLWMTTGNYGLIQYSG